MQAQEVLKGLIFSLLNDADILNAVSDGFFRLKLNVSLTWLPVYVVRGSAKFKQRLMKLITINYTVLFYQCRFHSFFYNFFMVS